MKLLPFCITWVILGLVSFITTSADEHDIDVEDATLIEYDEAANAEYSKLFSIRLTKKIRIDPAGGKPHSIQFAIVDEGTNGYISHGVTDQFRNEDLTIGIPVDRDPVALISYPPIKKGGKRIVKRYLLKQRC